ncbi:MAG: hypothetical protein R3C05_15285 [Pirellulaceae bacterium]
MQSRADAISKADGPESDDDEEANHIQGPFEAGAFTEPRRKRTYFVSYAWGDDTPEGLPHSGD